MRNIKPDLILPDFNRTGFYTRNFHRTEVECKGVNCCGHAAPMNLDLMGRAQALRDHIERAEGHTIPLHINSGFRCPKHNAATPGSSSTSLHMLGMALDFRRPGELSSTTFARYAAMFFPKVIVYSWGIHADVRFW